MSKSDGGPAFPRVESDGRGGELVSFGMSLRDYFAAKVMEGDWATQSEETGEWRNDADIYSLQKRAELYYRMSDAMLAERAKSTG